MHVLVEYQIHLGVPLQVFIWRAAEVPPWVLKKIHCCTHAAPLSFPKLYFVPLCQNVWMKHCTEYLGTTCRLLAYILYVDIYSTYCLISISVVQSNGVSPLQLSAALSAPWLSRYCTHSRLAAAAASCKAVDCVSVLWFKDTQWGDRNRKRTEEGKKKRGRRVIRTLVK